MAHHRQAHPRRHLTPARTAALTGRVAYSPDAYSAGWRGLDRPEVRLSAARRARNVVRAAEADAIEHSATYPMLADAAGVARQTFGSWQGPVCGPNMGAMAELVQAGSAAIEVRGLTKSYADVHAVRGIDLTVE